MGAYGYMGMNPFFGSGNGGAIGVCIQEVRLPRRRINATTFRRIERPPSEIAATCRGRKPGRRRRSRES
eukprot:4416498-Pyramimonas_sp.AAC.1